MIQSSIRLHAPIADGAQRGATPLTSRSDHDGTPRMQQLVSVSARPESGLLMEVVLGRVRRWMRLQIQHLSADERATVDRDIVDVTDEEALPVRPRAHQELRGPW
jgi:hypothetical protein